MIRKTITTLSVVALAAATTALPAAAASDSGATGVQIAASHNPCGAKKACNPCAAKSCNPCAAKKACNPCAAKR